MGKILSKSGDSLADVYDVKGSIAGIEELLSKDVNLVHEMGATIFSERLSGRILSITTGAILQDTQFDVAFSFSETSRLLGLQVVSTSPSRISRCQVSITSGPSFDNTDLPIFIWDSTLGSRAINVLIGGALQVLSILIPAQAQLIPNLMLGFDSPRPSSTITMRGLTTGFGAGNVTITALVYVAFPQLGGVSSRGLPIPGW